MDSALADYGLTLVLFSLGILASWAITRAYYRKGVERCRLSWSHEGDNFVVRRPTSFGDARIFIGKHKLIHPREERILVWNSGTKTILGTDITSSDPLLIRYPESIIKEAKIVEQTRPSIDANIIYNDKSSLIFSFDFLDPGDGFAVLALIDENPEHNENRYFHYAELSGTIKGLTEGISRVFYDEHKHGIRTFIISISISILFFLASVTISYEVFQQWKIDAFTISKIMASLITFLLSLLFMLFGVSERGPRDGHPPTRLISKSRRPVVAPPAANLRTD